MKKGILLTGLILLSPAPLYGQIISDSIAAQLDDVYESALENGTRDLDDSQFAESLFQLSVDRIDVNSASATDLLQVPGIDPLLASRILAYRRTHPFQRLDELLLVEGIDWQLLQDIRGFLKVEIDRVAAGSSGKTTVHAMSRMSRELQVGEGFRDGSYAGSPLKLYNILKGRCPLGMGIVVEAAGLAEKDAGEKNIADFATGYLSVGTASGTFRGVVGSYVVEAGQGLVFWRSAGTTKGSEVIATVSRNPRGLQPNISSDENGFLRGLAIQTNYRAFEITVVYSQKRINANVSEAGYITNIDASGLFRTSAELKKRGASSEQLYGLNANIRVYDGLSVGVRGCRSRFGNPIACSGLEATPNNVVSVAGIDFSYASADIGSFAELAMGRNRSIAAVGGVILEPVHGVAASLVVRSYPQSFLSLHGYGFGESGGQVRNERGYYTSARVSLFEWLTISTYYDQFASPGPTFVSLLPTSGNESMVLAQIRGNDEVSLQFQVRQKSQSAECIAADEFLRSNSVVGRSRQINYRATFEWWPSSTLRWKTRLEHVRVDRPWEAGVLRGFLFFQDLRVKLFRRLSLDGRVIVFDSDSYFSRIYEFESELRGTFANPSLYGKGIRLYILSRYEIGGAELSIKYSSTIKPGLRSLGSGPSEISGDTDNQISAQIDITL